MTAGERKHDSQADEGLSSQIVLFVPIVRGMTLSPDVLGWLSSFILVLTIGKQVFKQWRSGSSEGVSSWLFVGQMAASTGFTLYSWLIQSWVFVVTNFLMLCSAVVGFAIVRVHRRRGMSRSPARARAKSGLTPQRV